MATLDQRLPDVPGFKPQPSDDMAMCHGDPENIYKEEKDKITLSRKFIKMILIIE